MSADSAEKILAKIRGYVRENWGAPFVLGFMVLLVAAVVLMIMGLQYSAEEVANFAYFALVSGVVLQLVCFLKHGEKGGSDE
jgi:heme/copper-type cytochrome/quinol oxidase subunit 4